jgi:hypothetical protein
VPLVRPVNKQRDKSETRTGHTALSTQLVLRPGDTATCVLTRSEDRSDAPPDTEPAHRQRDGSPHEAHLHRGRKPKPRWGVKITSGGHISALLTVLSTGCGRSLRALGGEEELAGCELLYGD